MRLVSYREGHGLRAGAFAAAGVVDAGPSARALVEIGWDHIRARAGAGRPVARETLTLGAPIPDPGKIICVSTRGDVPALSLKFANALAAADQSIVLPETGKAVCEAGIAVVISRSGRDIPAADALAHVFGVMAFADVTAADVPLGTTIDTFAPCGPDLVSPDELGDLDALGLRVKHNGELVGERRTGDLDVRIPDLIALASRSTTLHSGDILVAGSGIAIDLDPGDVVEVEIDGLGTLRNTAVALTL